MPEYNYTLLTEYRHNASDLSSSNSTTLSLWAPTTIIAFTIMVITVVGNTTLIAVIVSRPSRRIKRVNVFLVNLAIGDLFVAFIVMSTEMFFFGYGEWVLGAVICSISAYLQIVLLAAATFLLTAMSYDRYQVIVHPMRCLARESKIWKKVAISWFLAFIFATPQLGIWVLRTVKSKRQCVSKGYTAEWQRKLYFSYLTCYIVIIPGILMTFCYWKVIHVVSTRAQDYSESVRQKTSSPRISLNSQRMRDSKRRAVIMTLTVILGFFICVTPYYIVTLIRILSDYRIKIPILNEAAKVILPAHSALNPFLYGFFMLKRKHIRYAFSILCCKKSLRERSLNPTEMNGIKKCFTPEDSTRITGACFTEQTHDDFSKKNVKVTLDKKDSKQIDISLTVIK